MPNAFQGIASPYDASLQILNIIDVYAINFMVNRNPLITRIPREDLDGESFAIVSRSYRPRTLTLTSTGVADGTTTLMTVADTSAVMVGDVYEFSAHGNTALIERCEVTAIPTATTLTIRRARESTTGRTNDVSVAGNVTVTLIGNSRTGGEIDQVGLAVAPTSVTQYAQTFQAPVQVSGSLQSNRAYQTAPGASSPLDQFKMEALQNLYDDMEYTSFYGIGEARGSTSDRPKQKGLKTLITSNNTTSPTNAGAYKPTDFIHDTLQPIRSRGGSPDFAFFSPEWMTGLATWGHAAQRIDAGVNIFGTPIDTFEAPFLPGLRFAFSPLLGSFTAVVLTSSEVRWRAKRAEFWNQRGNRGDATEGEFIAEGAIELANQGHHAWLSGVTAFSAT